MIYKGHRMKKSLAAFIAWRYLSFAQKDHNITFMMRICFFGIFIGTCALMLTLIITNGFEKVIHEKMQGICAQVIINAPGSKLNYDEVRTALLDTFPNLVAGISGNSNKQAIIEHGSNHHMLFVRGVDQHNEHLVSSIASKIISPNLKHPSDINQLLPTLLDNDGIIIGHKLAATLGVQRGDRMTILIPEPRTKKTIGLVPRHVQINGIFNVGLEEYDSSLAYCSLDTYNELFDEEGVDQLTLRLKQQIPTWHDTYMQYHDRPWHMLRAMAHLLINKMVQLFSWQQHETIATQQLQLFLSNLQVRHWQELYPDLVSSLRLEKYFSFAVLALIIFVASLNMIALLFMLIQQKRRDIAILSVLGSSQKLIQAIFLRIGLTITLFGSLSGLLVSCTLGYALEHYPFIPLPDVYYIAYLPARLEPEICLVVFFFTMLIGFLATWLPTKQTRYLTIAKILREE